MATASEAVSTAQPVLESSVTTCGFAVRAGAEMPAAAFDGLPEGFTHPQLLLVVLREAGPLLPFPRAALTTLEALVDWSCAEDWGAAGRHPLVWPTNHEIAARCNVDAATVGRHLQALRTTGAIAVRYGPGNCRAPIFGPKQTIVEAYGIDLSPLAALAARLRTQLTDARSRLTR